MHAFVDPSRSSVIFQFVNPVETNTLSLSLAGGLLKTRQGKQKYASFLMEYSSQVLE
uniref:Uncharacterized protein n=1 Tax=Anguilla anguilla TaxID=7936 RepID=A0A0E9VLN2_ANGAN